jgi:DtxR family transcriptional regulator, Mn-dependent transcriptional regulator
VPSLTVENYVKAIFQISLSQENSPVATGQIASALAVSPGTVTSMLKTLSESGLVTYTPYSGVSLTPEGAVLALRVIRRHRLIELFLSKTLEMSWDEVHEEAEQMEHAVSDLLVDRIDKFLGFPSVDPHGDPIPRSDGSLSVQTFENHPLADCPPSEEFRVIRVLDQSSEFLRFLTSLGLTIGTTGKVVSNQHTAGLLTIELSGREIPLGTNAASKILVVAD